MQRFLYWLEDWAHILAARVPARVWQALGFIVVIVLVALVFWWGVSVEANRCDSNGDCWPEY